jgi:hypothetical protein
MSMGQSSEFSPDSWQSRAQRRSPGSWTGGLARGLVHSGDLPSAQCAVRRPTHSVVSRLVRSVQSAKCKVQSEK